MKVSPSQQLENVTFFVDRSSGKNIIATGLQGLGLNIEKHDDHFTSTTPDVVWIKKCGEMNWVVISSDVRIKKNPLERAAILHAGVASFFFTSASITSTQEVEAIKNALPRIARMIANEPRPFIARISPDGLVEIWINHKDEDLIQKRVERRRQRKLQKHLAKNRKNVNKSLKK